MEENKEVYCIRVEPFLLDSLWEKCLPFLENPEIGEIEYTPLDEVYELCKTEDYQLWILMNGDELTGCFMTNIFQVTAGTNVLNIFYLSGHGVKVWIDELDKKVSEFAIENGCSFYSCIARKGFSKLVSGLEEAGVQYVKDLRRS